MFQFVIHLSLSLSLSFSAESFQVEISRWTPFSFDIRAGTSELIFLNVARAIARGSGDQVTERAIQRRSSFKNCRQLHTGAENSGPMLFIAA